MKRTKHSLSHYVLSTFDMGQLIPVSHFEVLPGDSIRMSTSMLMRVSPLMAPVMHPVAVRLHHWYVPFRVLHPDWEDFITGGTDGTGDGATVPKSDAIAAAGLPPKTLADYLGIPTNIDIPAPGVNIWPVLAYEAIVNENYRDQDLQPELTSHSINQPVFNVAWEKDQFTAARPWSQKGPEVTVPLASSAPVVPDAANAGPTWQINAEGGRALAGNNAGVVTVTPVPTAFGQINWDNPHLMADLTAASATSINDLRLAFALQRYQEARAIYGSRYTEYLRFLGVHSSDSRLQRPEYLGGGRATISFSEVLRTGNSDGEVADAPVGELAGHGISAMRSRRFLRFFEEHGIVMTLCSVRPRSIYTDGLRKSWTRTTKEDYWQRELEQIGQQEVLNREVYAAGPDHAGVFGYNDRYYDYRHEPSYVTGEFRDILNDWHLARTFAAPPALNSDFITCTPSKRIHAEQTQNSLWCMFSHSIQARRLVSNRTIGRIF